MQQVHEAGRAAHKDAAACGINQLEKEQEMKRRPIERRTKAGRRVEAVVKRQAAQPGPGQLPAAPDACGAKQSEPEDVGGGLNLLSPKAFKGKGVLCELRRASESLARTDYLMQELVAMTRSVRSRELSLAALRYKADGRVVVRWKRVGVSGTIRFEEAAEIWGRYAEPLRSWYATVSKQAEMLNTRHRKGMARIRELQAQLPTMPLFPRTPDEADENRLHPLAQKRLDEFVVAAAIV